jgi:hypothetical protein
MVVLTLGRLDTHGELPIRVVIIEAMVREKGAGFTF